MIHTLVIDDEPLAIGNLCTLLEKYCPEVSVVGSASDAHSALLHIERLKPDMVFLDIEMPGENAFDLLAKFKQRSFEVVFVTAFDTFALKAIKQDITDYILKPIDKNDLMQAVEKATRTMHLKKHQRGLAETPTATVHNAHTIALPTLDGLMFVRKNDVLYCAADGKYTVFHLAGNEKITVSKNIGEYEQVLGSEQFVRIHHHYLVNILHIKKYLKGRGGCVVMNNGTTLEVSARKKDEFFGKLLR